MLTQSGMNFGLKKRPENRGMELKPESDAQHCKRRSKNPSVKQPNRSVAPE